MRAKRNVHHPSRKKLICPAEGPSFTSSLLLNEIFVWWLSGWYCCTNLGVFCPVFGLHQPVHFHYFCCFWSIANLQRIYVLLFFLTTRLASLCKGLERISWFYSTRSNSGRNGDQIDDEWKIFSIWPKSFRNNDRIIMDNYIRRGWIFVQFIA